MLVQVLLRLPAGFSLSSSASSTPPPLHPDNWLTRAPTVPDPDLEIRGARSSRPKDKGEGAVSPPNVFVPSGPQFGRKIRGAGSPGPSPESATVLTCLDCVNSVYIFCPVILSDTRQPEVRSSASLSFFTLSGTICLRIWANPLPKNG